VAATQEKYREASSDGADGVVWSRKFLDHTTPSARANEASRLFFVAQPPLLLLRRGLPGTRTPSWFALKPHSQVDTCAEEVGGGPLSNYR